MKIADICFRAIKNNTNVFKQDCVVDLYKMDETANILATALKKAAKNSGYILSIKKNKFTIDNGSYPSHN